MIDQKANIFSKLDVRRQWLGGGYSLAYEISAPLTPPLLSDLIDRCIRSLIPQDFFQRKTAINVKGRDALNMIDPAIPEQEKPTADEILFLSGDVPLASASGESESHFLKFRINSRFHSFEGNHEILHSAVAERHGDYAHDIPFQYLGRIFPFRPNRFRLGLDFFKGRFLSGLVGIAPTVTETLLLEADSTNFLFRLSAEHARHRDTPPAQTMNTFQSLDGILQTVLGFSCLQDFRLKAV